MSRHSLSHLLLVWLLAGLVLLGTSSAAHAEGSPNLAVSVQSAKSVLYGEPASVTLTASNPAGQPHGYNLSYRAVLPVGVSYRAGSGKAEGATLAPQQVANEPATGETTLIWSNVQDLSPSSHGSLSFEVEPSVSHFTVGDSYTIEAGAFIASEPRFLPKFNANGTPDGPAAGSFTGFATGSAETTITALEITQSDPAPKGELLRGVHDHQTEYTLVVRNTDVKSTSDVAVSEWLPAGLEYLGCGGPGMDHTTDAPTNPGSAEEYPGSGLIEAGALSACQAASSVATVETDPDGSGPDPDAVYTHVQWTLDTIPAGGTVTLKFLAAVPLRENTLTWTKGEPSTSGEAQAADLDNNSGRETRDGETLTTYATAAGDYASTLPVSTENFLTRTAKDLIIEKSADSTVLEDQQITLWTLRIESSEYRYNTGVEVTETMPNGLCPLGAHNFTNGLQSSDSECAPTAEAADPSSEYSSASENENGTWTLTWNASTDAALTNLQANESTTITFATRTRSHYQSDHKEAEPILADDSVTNDVSAQATTNVVCEGHSDCSVAGSTPIDHERPLSEAISDSASVGLSASGPSIGKQIAATSTPECEGITYTSSVPVYRPGDLICWKLGVSFPERLFTQGEQVADFLPLGTIFDSAFNGGKGERSTSSDTLPETTFEDSAAGGSAGGEVQWTLPDGGTVAHGGQVFERVIATTATLPGGAAPGELQGNLMKFANRNTEGESFSQRAEANFELQFPHLSLTKQVTEVAGKAITPAGEASVQGGDTAKFALTLSNSGEVEAEEATVWDVLPSGLTCAAISAISNKGLCSEGKIFWGETGQGEEAITVAAKGTSTLSFVATVPGRVGPGTVLEDHAGIVDYSSATNTGGIFRYIPEKNINPMIESELSEKANVAPAESSATLKVPNASVAKTHTTTIDKPGDGAEQATIGEVVEYKISATVPAGTTLGGTAKLSDPQLPSERLTLVPGSESVDVDGSPASGFTIEEIGGSPMLAFPAEYAVAAGGANAVVEMHFDAYVANVAANARGGTIANTGKLTWTDPISGAEEHVTSPANDVPIVEPSISLKESNNGGSSVQGGQPVAYTLELSDAAGASPAYGNVVVDTVPTGVTPTNVKGEPLAEGELTEDGGVWSASSRTITWNVATLESGETDAFHYDVTVDEPPVSGTSLTDDAVATTTSLPGTSEVEREHRRTTGTGYKAEASNTLVPSGPTIAKTSDSATATIGHRITYTLTVSLPAHVTSFDDTVIDTLPGSLEFGEYVSAACTAGCPPEAAPAVKTYTPTVNGSGTTSIAWSFGDLAATEDGRTVVLTYTAIVRETHRDGGAPVSAGETIENAVSVDYDHSKKLSFEEGTIPPATGFESKEGPATATTEVVEPKVTIEKAVSVAGGAYTAGPDLSTAEDALAYRLSVKNTGTAPAYDVVVEDAPASNIVEVQATTNSGDLTHAWSSPAPESSWEIPGPIAPGETVVLGYSAHLAPVASLHDGEQLTNTAQVPSYYGVSEAERTATVNKGIAYRHYTEDPSAAATVKVELPVLEVTKTPAQAAIAAGEADSYAIAVKNTGSGTARHLVVEDTLPSGMTYAAGTATATPAGGFSEKSAVGGAIVWEDASLASGATLTITLPVQTSPSLSEGTQLVNHVTASSEEHPTPASASGTIGVSTRARLKLEKTALTPTVLDGQDATFSLKTSNAGPSDAAEVQVTDVLPVGLTYASASGAECEAHGQTVECLLGTLASGSSTTIELVVVTDQAGSYTNTASVSSATLNPAPAGSESSAQLEVEPAADLSLLKTTRAQVNAPGDLAYALTATNHGPDTAHEVVITDPLPAGVSFVSASAGCTLHEATVTCALGELANGASAAVQITVAVPATSTPHATYKLENTASVSALEGDPEPANNVSTAVTTIDPAADLSIVKTGPASVAVGGAVTWMLNIENHGPDSAEETVVSDPLPGGVELQDAEASQGSCSSASGVLTCALGTLADGATARIAVSAIAPSTAGPLVNTATVSSADYDPEPLNNSSSVTTDVIAPASPTQTPEKPPVSETTKHAKRVGPAPPAAARLSLSLTLPDRMIVPGARLVYHLTLRNVGKATAIDPVVCEPVPAQATVLALHGGKLAKGSVCFRLAKLASGKRRVFTLVLRADGNARGSIFDLATASARGVEQAHAKLRRAVHGEVAPHAENGVTG